MPRTGQPSATDGYIILHFPAWGGENSDWPADSLAPAQLSATQDIAHSGPELVRRGGQFREPNSQTSAGQTVVAGTVANYSTGQKVIVQTISAEGNTVGRFFQTSAGMSTWVGLGTSAFGWPATFALLSDVLAIATNGGTLIGTSGNDGVFSMGSGAPSARFLMSYKNRLFACGHDVSADEMKYTAIGATTGLPTVTDWLTTGNAGNRIFAQGEGFRLIGAAADQDSWYAFKRNRVLAVGGSTPAGWVTNEADREWGPYHRSVAIVGRGLIGANEEGICSVLQGKVEPLLPDRLLKYWQTLNLANVSAFQGAWSGARNQYRLMVQEGALTWAMLTGVLEPGKPIAWYRWAVPARCLLARLVGGNRVDFYRGGSADGYLYRMDQGTQDASANFAASFRTGILDNGRPWEDKIFRWAWVVGRTRGPFNISCSFTVHDEDGKPVPVGNRLRLWDATSAAADPFNPDVRRASFNLDGQLGWGIDVAVAFEPSSDGSIHKIIIGYDLASRDGRGKAR